MDDPNALLGEEVAGFYFNVEVVFGGLVADGSFLLRDEVATEQGGLELVVAGQIAVVLLVEVGESLR